MVISEDESGCKMFWEEEVPVALSVSADTTRGVKGNYKSNMGRRHSTESFSSHVRKSKSSSAKSSISKSLSNCPISHEELLRSKTKKNAITEREAKDITGKIMEMIVKKGYPFSIFDPIDGEDSPKTALLRELRPAFVEDCLPSSYHIGGLYLELIYARTMRQTTKSIKAALERGFGTLLFDGWQDINGSSVVNVL